MDNKEKKVELIIKTFINDGGNGLFDFSAKIKGDLHIIEDNYYILRNKDNNKIAEKKQNIECDIELYDILFLIRKSLLNNNSFEIINPLRINNQKNETNINIIKYCGSWYVIKSNNNLYSNNDEDYCLNENDIIKFGNKIYEIIKKIILKKIRKKKIIKN